MRFSIFATFLSLAILAKASNNPDDPNGSLFYLVKPSCNYYRCQVKTHPGSVLPIEWLNPVKGKIDIFFNPEDDQKGLQRYTIAKNIGAHNNKNKCDAQGQNGCGAFDWTVPANVKPGNYSVEIHSLKQKKVHGYSDIVTVVAGKNKRSAPEKVQEEKKDASKKSNDHKDAAKKTQEHKDATKETKEDKDASKKTKHHKDTTEKPKHHKNATEPAKQHHKHKNATEPISHHKDHKNATEAVKHHKHKNATETAKHHHRSKTEHSKHHHKNATKSAEHKKHVKHENKTKTSEHKRKRMVQAALF